jgi:hypothetical protein
MTNQTRKSVLFNLLLMFFPTIVFSQYTGVPWNGSQWKIGKNNQENFRNTIICWKYDIGEAEPSDLTPPASNLTAVIGKNEGVLRSNMDAPTINARVLGAAEEDRTLHQTDIDLTNSYSNFQWHAVDQRWRDGGQWARYTIQFEPGNYLFLNRGYPNTNGNFNLLLTIYDTDMNIVYGPVERNNLGSLGTHTTDLGFAPDGVYADLPPTPGNATRWYKWDDTFDLDGTYVVQIHSLRAGALGGAIGEFTFMETLVATPRILSFSADPIAGCDGKTTLQVYAEPDIEGNTLYYQFRFKDKLVGNEWSADSLLEIHTPGEWTVVVREEGSVFTSVEKLLVEKINCANTPYPEQAAVIPGTIHLQEFDQGGEGIAYNELTSPLVNSGSWTTRNNEEYGTMGVDIEEIDTRVVITEMGYYGEDANSGEWLMYSVDVEEDGDYLVTLHYHPNSVNSDRKLMLEFNNNEEHFDDFTFNIIGNDLKAESNLNSIMTDDWQTLEYSNPVTLLKGHYSMKLYSNSGEIYLDQLEFHQTEHITPVLELAEQEVIVTFPAFITSNKNVDVYLVPEGTMPGDDLASLQLLRMRVVPDVITQLPTNELQPGNYILYGVDNTGAISEGRDLVIKDLPPDLEYDYAEIDGLVVIDASSLSAAGSWQKASGIAGYTGNGYLFWTGGQFFNNASNGRINIKVLIRTPGVYRFDWRVRIGAGTDNTEHNDTWLRIQADDFYGYRSNGNTFVHPRPLCQTSSYGCPAGSSTDGFFKIFGGNLSSWMWRAVTSDHNDHQIFARFDNPGIYTFTIAARSSYHLIDRMIMYHAETVTQIYAQNLQHPETINILTGNKEPGKTSASTRLVVYPNPVSSRIWIGFGPIKTCYEYRIMTHLGQLVTSGTLHNESTGIDISGLNQGLYIIAITDPHGYRRSGVFLRQE